MHSPSGEPLDLAIPAREPSNPSTTSLPLFSSDSASSSNPGSPSLFASNKLFLDRRGHDSPFSSSATSGYATSEGSNSQSDSRSRKRSNPAPSQGLETRKEGLMDTPRERTATTLEQKIALSSLWDLVSSFVPCPPSCTSGLADFFLSERKKFERKRNF